MSDPVDRWVKSFVNLSEADQCKVVDETIRDTEAKIQELTSLHRTVVRFKERHQSKWDKEHLEFDLGDV